MQKKKSHTRPLLIHFLLVIANSEILAGNYSRGMEPLLKKSNADRNELLRAMDLRLTVLRDELASVFNRAAGASCSLEQIVDLEAFSAHFGAVEMRDSLAKYLALCQKDQNAGPETAQHTHSHDSNVNDGKLGAGVAKEDLPVDTIEHSRVGVSPAKIAQAERQSSTEGDGSSSSSDEEQSTVERSRPLIRSASPKRSASPMRRIQIGRSGSRRSTALTIKSLNYFPARERISANRDVAGNSSGDDEAGQTAKKPENTVRRMSVQDAINLFESKQRDQKSDTQKWRSSIDMSTSCANKAVLRRWSAGMSTTQRLPEASSEGGWQDTGDTSAAELLQKNIVDAKIESDLLASSPDPVDIITEATSSGVADNEVPPLSESPADIPFARADEVPDRATASAEWSRQKEAELNQMLMKIMETKPARQRNTTSASKGNKEHSTDQRGGFYDHYKEKRDEKLRGENSRKRAEKEAHFKAMQETLDQRKAEISSKSKNVGIGRKQESTSQSQPLRRSSSASIQSKKELPKPAAVKKPSSKTTPLPAARKSWPSTPLPRSTGPQSNKIPSATSSGTTPTRRKPQPTPSLAKPSPKVDRFQPQRKATKGTKSESKQTVKGGEEKKNETATKSAKSAKTKALTTSTDDTSAVPSKPSFYSKVTKKSSVVPLESKPFLKKGTGIGPGVGPGVVKAKTSQSDDSSKDSGNLTHPQENDAVAAAPLETTAEVVPDAAEAQQSAIEGVESEILMQSSSECENTENSGKTSAEADETHTKTEESPTQDAVEEIEADGDSGISSAAWVEVEQQELPLCSDSDPSQLAMPANIAPVSISSPRVRHSLSQMLQADSGEPEIMEWGNAENPPAIVYQKDSPKGLKRFLKFARKSKGDANITGWASPSAFSEGEEDAEELKANGRRNADALLRKSSQQVKGFGLQKTMLSEGCDGGNSSKRDYTAAHELLSGPSGANAFMHQVSHKLHEGQTPTATASTKG
ncbi:hypothetical protein ACLOJK_031572 [Asimina triloba]